ncbi:abrin-d-like [Elaeis guineensis]|uniref:abrin-d-like n=1 Tax=Elaeis guineensis var. tenera TaxID=51953 RepID=UPI003C6D7860
MERYNLVDATGDNFHEFLERLRDTLAARRDRHAIRVLRDPANAPTNIQRYVGVELSTWRVSITLAIDITSLYIVAYQAGDWAYFLGDAPESATSNLFRGTRQYTLSFDGNYDSLINAANQTREEIRLGIEELRGAVNYLYRNCWNIPIGLPHAD